MYKQFLFRVRTSTLLLDLLRDSDCLCCTLGSRSKFKPVSDTILEYFVLFVDWVSLLNVATLVAHIDKNT